MKPISLIEGMELEDAAADLKTSERVEQYRLGKQAVYFPALPRKKYLPFAAIRSVTRSHRNISAGKCVPVEEQRPALLLQTEQGEFRLEPEREKSADLLQRAIEAAIRNE